MKATEDQIAAICCLTEDILRWPDHYEDPQCRMSDAEIVTTAVVAMMFFGGNFEKFRAMLRSSRHIPNMLNASWFCRRPHRIRDLFFAISVFFSEVWKNLNTDSVYLIDSFPVAVCDNIRIPHSRIYKEEECRGYNASERRYFYGLKVHMMCAGRGEPVEIFFTPGHVSDAEGLRLFAFNLPEKSIVYGDRSYNNYEIEDILRETGNIRLMPIRKKNLRRQYPPYVEYLRKKARKTVETANSLITHKTC
ncbi:IS982 family transposase [Desulfonema magnum]|uniref:Transposase DDE domain-containing protein n=1 Tax=Desulfonema magnum TaxID=45655 RepID=A0A975GQA8_9BACT|nr:IS982 family transposase [Desulfonema magnum]QTA88753.1 Transposase DDE domain-containing protein [Desulfonema magnum]